MHCQKYSQAHIFVETALLGLTWSEIKPGSDANMITGTASEKERKASPLPLSLVNHPPASGRNAILFSAPKLSTEGKYCTSLWNNQESLGISQQTLQDSAWPGVVCNSALTQTQPNSGCLYTKTLA